MEQEHHTNSSASEQPQESLLSKYLPWTRFADNVIMVLKTMGLSRRQITSVLCGEEVAVTGEIVNPEDMRTLLISSSVVSIEVKDAGMTCSVNINGKPYHSYFKEYYEREVLLKNAGKYSSVVEDLYQENLRMRRLLGGKARAYR